MNLLRRLFSTFGVALTLVAALSLVAAGGAHRMGRGDSAAEAIAAIYGSSAVICGDTEGPSQEGVDCPVCHLVGAAVLPEPVTGDRPMILVVVASTQVAQSQRAIDPPVDPSRSLRGPPLV
jgi:hypothetical protein